MSVGIYAIDGPGTWRYVGQSLCVEQRWYEHRSLLNRGLHSSRKLQAAWFAVKNHKHLFNFKLLELCSYASLTNREQYWIDKAKPLLYNESGVAGSVRTCLSIPIQLDDGQVFGSLLEFIHACKYTGYGSIPRNPDFNEIAIRRGVMVGTRERKQTNGIKIVLANGLMFPSMEQFAKACKYSNPTSISRDIAKGQTYDQIAIRRGVLLPCVI